MAGQDKIFVVKNGLTVNGGILFANNSKVGINNTTPDSALTVTGSANVQGTLQVVNAATFSNTVNITGELSVANINTIPVSAFILQNSVPTYTNVATFNANVAINSGLIANGNIGWAGAVLLSNGSSIYWGTASGVSVAGAGNNTEIQFNRNGALGANATFSFNEATGLMTTNTLTVSQTGVYFVANGNVGFGTASPTYKASLQGSVNAVFGIDVYNSSTNNSAESSGIFRTVGTTGVKVGQSKNGNGAFVWLAENAPLEFGTSNTARVRVAGNGFVGIACSSPTTELDVSGSITGTVVRTGATVTMNSTVINVGTTTINATNYSGVANNALFLGGNAASAFQLNSTLNANIAAYLPTYTGVVNGSSHTGTSFTAGAFVANSTTVNSTVVTVGGSWTINATHVQSATGNVIANRIEGGAVTSSDSGVVGYSNTGYGVSGSSYGTGGGLVGVAYAGGPAVAGYSNSGVGGYFQSNTNAPLQVVANTTTVLYVNPAGNTGFGTSAPGTKVNVHGGPVSVTGIGNTNYALYANTNANNISGLYFGSDGNALFALRSAVNAQMTLYTNNYCLGIQTASPAYTVDINGSLKATSTCVLGDIYSAVDGKYRIAFGSSSTTVYRSGNDSGYQHLWERNDGTDIAVISDGSLYVVGNITAYWSDQRLKVIYNEIQPMDSLNRICSLNAYRHGWTEEGRLYSQRSEDWQEDSLLAQQVQAVIPEAVVVNELAKAQGKDYLSLNESKIIPHLVNAIKALKAEIEELKKAH